ncbi:MAG: cbb3-type cytochrome c oxidase subunit I [Gammaproteobacteria bacterium]
MENVFAFSPSDRHAANLAKGWLILGIGAVAASGLFSILLVLARTPVIQDVIPWVDFFHTALVVHVDLSVLIWFLSFTSVIWCMGGVSRLPAIDQAALYLSATGTMMIILAPLTGNAQPLLNNYVPVLQQTFFLVALIIFAMGFALRIMTQLMDGFTLPEQWNGTHALTIGNKVAAISAAIAALVLVWSWTALNVADDYYYEFLFWGPGHILQFTYTIMVLVVWLWLAQIAGIRIRTHPRKIALLLILAGFPVVIAPVICLLADIDSINYRLLFTGLMTYGGLFALPLGLLIVYRLITSLRADTDQQIARAALICSLTLFTAGGALGFLIQGINVTIPAHYHGSIIGITLAFFGLTYYLLPLLAYRTPSTRMAVIQLYLYGTGQLMHIAGLAWSGGYGVQRKTAGAAQGLERLPEIAGMAMMGLGGLIAIIGGILFVVIVLYSMWPERKHA